MCARACYGRDGVIKDEAQLIVIGGTIHTADEASPSAQAFAVRGGRFACVGSVADAMALRGPSTTVLDVREQTVLPGFVDAHLHLTYLGLRLEQVDLDGVQSAEELVERTRSFTHTTGDSWILGRGWDETRWSEPRLPSHEQLSAALPHRPVALTRVDGHAVLVNARAMTIAGIDETTPDPPGGRIVRDGNGKPTGVLVDAAETLVFDAVPKPSHDRLMRATRAAIAQCNRYGITAVAEPGCDGNVLAAHAELIARGEYSIRNYAMLDDEPRLIEAHLRGGRIDAAHDGRLWVRAIKMYADGALGSRGAALLAPYSDDPKNSGLILASRERIESVTEDALRAGFQVCVHAIGDRANRNALDAFEAAIGRVRPDFDPRLRIEHAQVVAPQDVPRFARLGVIASMQTTHAISDARWVRARLGPERSAHAYAWRSLLAAGAVVANGTDAPVESADPARSFVAAVTHAGWNPEERMTRREALLAMTIVPARAAFAERLIGSIALGKYADFVVIDRDWMTAAIESIEATRTIATYFAGRRVF